MVQVIGFVIKSLLTIVKARLAREHWTLVVADVDKARRAHELDMRREEQKTFDEMATQANGVNSLLVTRQMNTYPALT